MPAPSPEEPSARCVLRRRPASLSQVSGGTTGNRRASVARPSLSSTRRWACAPRALCTRPEWTLGARARGGGGAGGGAGLGWARQHAVAPWGTDGRVSPLTRASGRFSGEDHQEDHAQADVQRVQGRPPEADQTRQALRDLRQEAQDQGPDVLSRILIVILLVKKLKTVRSSAGFSPEAQPKPRFGRAGSGASRSRGTMSFRFMAPSPPPPPPPIDCIDCRVGLCEEGRSRLFGASKAECEAMEDAGQEELALIESLTNGTGTRACIDVRAAPRDTRRNSRWTLDCGAPSCRRWRCCGAHRRRW